jgi:hypothetical protein
MSRVPFILLVVLSACTYNPPPDVTLVAAEGKYFKLGDPIHLQFSESVTKDSLAIRVWPGEEKFYTLEGERKADVKPLVDTCAAGDGKCTGGTKVALDTNGTTATLDIPADKLAILDRPLVLEVMGTLADESGHSRKVSVFFDFQIVETIWDPFAEVVEEATDVTAQTETLDDAAPAEPLGVIVGHMLFFAEFTSPIKLPQQFWSDLQIDQLTGHFVLLMCDADPIDGAPKNTSNPAELKWDNGDESFIFVMHGKVQRDKDSKLTFQSEPFTMAQTIGPITFELRGMVASGTIDQSGELAVWNGTLAVKEVYYEVGGQETIYPADQANFQLFEVAPELVPQGVPTVCMPDPCSTIGGKCDLLPDWPPEDVCAER